MEQLERGKSGRLTKREMMWYRLTRDRGKKGLPLTTEARKMFGRHGAKFLSDVKHIRFEPGEPVAVSVNFTIEMREGTWTPYKKGTVVGDYPLFVRVNHGEPWRNETYLKTDMLVDKVRIIRLKEVQAG